MNLIVDLHKKKFDREPLVVSTAPAVIRLLGVVSENNREYVLQSAFNKYLSVSISLRNDFIINCYSVELDDNKKCPIKNLKNKKEDRWLNLIKGVISEYSLIDCESSGMDILIKSNIPMQVGFASSTALCVAVSMAINELYKYHLSDMQIVQTSFLSESRFMEKKDVFLLDAMTSFFSKDNSIMFFDVQKMSYEYHNLHNELFKIYILDSNVPVQIDKEEEKRRINLFNEIGAMLKKCDKNSIKEFDEFDLKQSINSISENARRFCTHIVGENNRVIEFLKAADNGKVNILGKLLTRSQESLRDNFEVSCPEVDWLIKRVVEIEGVYGARLVGRGFGGSLVIGANSGALNNFSTKLEEYDKIFGFIANYKEIEFVTGATILFSSN